MKIDLNVDMIDKIVVEACTNYRDILKEELALYDEDPDKFWMHDDDVIHGKQMIVHLGAVIRDFGG